MKLKHKIDFEGLEKYLKELKKEEIETYWVKPEIKKLISCTTMLEIEYFNKDKSKIPAELIIAFGEPFLVDALGNDLSIVILSRRGYKLPTGRVINAKFVKTIIPDCRAVYGTPLNGYWKIPTKFIEAI